MTWKKVAAVVLTIVFVCSVTLVLVLMSGPAPAQAHESYTYKPGCHCGKPKTTTTQKPTVTTKRPTTTTRAAATTTSTEVTTTTTMATFSAGVGLPRYFHDEPNNGQELDVARALVAGLALAAGNQPPEAPGGDGTSGGADGGVGTDAAEAAGAAEDAGGTAVDPAAEAAAAEVEYTPPNYYVSPVAILFLLVYAASFVLYKTKRIRVATHRKIWNLLLLSTFLVTGVFGLILAIGISQDPPWMLPRSLLFWHVEIGILMSLISFFHIGWHLKYYLAVVTGRSGATGRKAAERARFEEDIRRRAGQGTAVPVRIDEQTRGPGSERRR